MNPALLVLGIACLLPGSAMAAGDEDHRTGAEIMAEVRARHDIYPYSYEEQNFVLTDREGRQTVRQARRFWRVEKGGVFRFLLVFTEPPEIHGVSLLAEHRTNGESKGGVYLPAFGKTVKSGSDLAGDVPIMGTDFAVTDLSPENLEEHRYVRRLDRVYADETYHVVDAYPLVRGEGLDDRGWRRHLIRKDNLFIERTHYFDRNDRLVKRLTRHNIKRILGSGWRADMILMENLREHHTTLLKVDRRVHSEDYAPRELFEPDTLFENLHLGDPASWTAREQLGS